MSNDTRARYSVPKDLSTCALSNGHVYIAVSNLPNAGYGLFARKSFQRGEYITYYDGVVMDWLEAKRLCKNNKQPCSHCSIWIGIHRRIPWIEYQVTPWCRVCRKRRQVGSQQYLFYVEKQCHMVASQTSYRTTH